MVSRIELILLALILFFVSKSFYNGSTYEKTVNLVKQKEIELLDAKLQESNETASQSIIYAGRVIKSTNEMIFDDFRMYSPAVSIYTRHAVQRERTITLENNATITKTDGTRYYTKNASYNRDTMVLKLEESFTLHDRFGDAVGVDMKYDTNRKQIEAHKVKANYTIEQ